MFCVSGEEQDMVCAVEKRARLSGFNSLDGRIVGSVAWCRMLFTGRPCFSFGMMSEILDLQDGIYFENKRRQECGEEHIKFQVLSSSHPQVFNLGGDLQLFLSAIKAKDVPLLRGYAYACVEAIYKNWSGLAANIITIGLVQGSALGGGMEAALSSNFIIAERGSKFGLPESLFGLFPGMGAYPFLAARVGMVRAEKIILSGKVYSAEEMYEIGVVDVLTEVGNGVDATASFIEKNIGKHAMLASLMQQRRAYFPATLSALYRDADLWTETAMSLSERDLSRMERLVSSQLKL